MALFTLNRNLTYRSTNGVLSFEKGVPTWVPPYMHNEIASIGGERVDGENVDVLGPEEVEPEPMSQEAREQQVFIAFEQIKSKNDAKDFTGQGVPTVKAVEKITGFDVDRTELVELWTKFSAIEE